MPVKHLSHPYGFFFYKTDCFGKVLKPQTLRVALWDRICIWEQPSHYSWVVLCSVTILGARKKNSGTCKDRRGQKRERRGSQLQYAVWV